MKACQDHVVTIEYRMVDEEANLIDSTDDAEPLSFIQGHGMILSTIERAVEGHQAGERLTFHLSPEDAFGQPDPARIRTIPLSQFPTDQTPYPGARFFVKKEDQDVAVTIVAVEGRVVARVRIDQVVARRAVTAGWVVEIVACVTVGLVIRSLVPFVLAGDSPLPIGLASDRHQVRSARCAVEVVRTVLRGAVVLSTARLAIV